MTSAPVIAPPAQATGPDELERALALALSLAERAEALAFALALPELDPIELPPVVGDEFDQARLRSAGPMYLAAELERAGLLPAADALAGVFVAGGLHADLGPVGERLVEYWRDRHERFSVEERRAFFARLFGGPQQTTLARRAPVNVDFEALLIDLAEAIHKLEAPAGFLSQPASEEAVRGAAARLAENLTSRSTGIPLPSARAIIGAIDRALALFKEPSVQAALGARSPWAAVRAAAERYLGEAPRLEAHIERGKAGLLLLGWLAEAVVTLDPARPLRRPDRQVVVAAGVWLHASLSLSERAAGRALTAT